MVGFRSVDGRARPFEIEVVATGGAEDSTLLLASARRVRGRWEPNPTWYTYAEVGNYTSVWPRVYSKEGGVDVGGCPAGAPCSDPAALEPAGLHTFRRQMSGPAEGLHEHWLAWHAFRRVTWRLLTPGWQVVTGLERRGARLHLFRGYDGQGVHVAVNQRHVERFRSVAARGGRHGSVAFASLPCQRLGGVPTGTGTADLAGGDADSGRLLDCWTYTGFAASRGATTWQLAGSATGTGGILHRLVVFDLPRP